MRICLSRVAVSGLVVLAFQAAVWGQFSGNAGATRATGGAGGGDTPTLSGAGQLSVPSQFDRDSRQPGEFVGTDAADTREFVGQVGAGAGGSSSRRTFNQTSAARRGQNANRGGTSRNTAEIRSAIRLGFGYQLPAFASASASDDLNLALNARLQRTTRFQARSPVEVSLGDDGATLRGVVATKYDRSLVEQMVRLEPGIWRVQNELTVAEATPPADPEPPAQQLPAPLQ